MLIESLSLSHNTNTNMMSPFTDAGEQFVVHWQTRFTKQDSARFLDIGCTLAT